MGCNSGKDGKGVPYAFVPETKADGFVWAFNIQKSDAVRKPFKFPPLKPEDVRIKITHFSVGQSDAQMVNEMNPGSFPLVPGTSVVGEVVLVGPEVHNVKIGDQVGFGSIRYSCRACEFCVKEEEQFCSAAQNNYTDEFGGFSTHFQGSSKWAIPIPNSIPPEKAVPLLHAGVSVYSALKRFGQNGQKLAIYGFGERGMLALQFAIKLGLKVTVFCTQPEKKILALSLGATDFIVPNEEEFKNKTLNYDLVFLTEYNLDSETIEKIVNLVKQEGTFVKIGKSMTGKNVEINFATLIFFNRKITGVQSGSRKDHFNVIQFAIRNDINPLVEVQPIETLNDAMKMVHSGEANKSIIIKL